MKWLVERRDCLHRTAWHDLLGIDAAMWTDLVERGVFEPATEDTFRMCFVGLFALPHDLVVVLPKFSALPPPGSALLALHRVLAHYFARSETQRSIHEDEQSALLHQDDTAFTEYQLWLTLRAWYRSHGVYLRSQREFGEHWGRVVDWPRTLGRAVAMHGDYAAVYPSPIMARPFAHASEVTRIQISALSQLETKYRFDGEPPLDAADRAAYGTLRHRLEKERATLAMLVRREMNAAYRTDEIAMLSALYEWLREDRYGRDGPTTVRLFGTSRFEYVWEDACRVAFGNGPKIAMASPFWSIDGLPPKKGAPSRPDIWATLPDTRQAVLDAKYYWPLPQSLPGWADVVKQLFYALASAKNGELINCFLFPDPGAVGIARRGHVDFRYGEELPAPDFRSVLAFGVEPDALFARYAENLLAHDWLADISLSA